jgi:hypothetical protein
MARVVTRLETFPAESRSQTEIAFDPFGAETVKLEGSVPETQVHPTGEVSFSSRQYSE